MYEELTALASSLMAELVDKSRLRPGALVVVGCSTSEVTGGSIGKASDPGAAQALLRGILPVLQQAGLFLAAQCCEHLNRALIVERETAERFGYEIVNARPRPKAGGSFATAAFEAMRDPVAVESVRASAGLDIGDTLIGMHLKAVVVPLRLSTDTLGAAHVTAARTRPKLIGGSRAEYVEEY